MNENYLTMQEGWRQMPRMLNLEGAWNVRDLGGYPAERGSYVAWGKVYRAGDLNCLVSSDIKHLEERKIATIIDFRTQEEKDAAPDCAIGTVVNSIHLEISPANMTALHTFTAENGEARMVEIYEALVTSFQDVYARFFEILAQPNALPLLFHCSGGKDRTGLAAALFLSSLGVDRRIIMEDYMMSAAPSEAKYSHMLKSHPELAPLITVKPRYLQAAFDAIDRDYGGMQAYLENRLNADTNLIKSIYLASGLPNPEKY